jgi:hypothetical protein
MAAERMLVGGAVWVDQHLRNGLLKEWLDGQAYIRKLRSHHPGARPVYNQNDRPHVGYIRFMKSECPPPGKINGKSQSCCKVAGWFRRWPSNRDGSQIKQGIGGFGMRWARRPAQNVAFGKGGRSGA